MRLEVPLQDHLKLHEGSPKGEQRAGSAVQETLQRAGCTTPSSCLGNLLLHNLQQQQPQLLARSGSILPALPAPQPQNTFPSSPHCWPESPLPCFSTEGTSMPSRVYSLFHRPSCIPKAGRSEWAALAAGWPGQPLHRVPTPAALSGSPHASHLLARWQRAQEALAVPAAHHGQAGTSLAARLMPSCSSAQSFKQLSILISRFTLPSHNSARF